MTQFPAGFPHQLLAPQMQILVREQLPDLVRQHLPQFIESEAFKKQVADLVAPLIPAELEREMPGRLADQMERGAEAVDKLVQRGHAALASAEVQIQRLRQPADDGLARLTKALKDVEDTASSHKVQISKELDDHRRFVTEKREQFVNEFLHEVAGIKDQKSRWVSQEKQHWWHSFGSGIALFVLLAALFATAWTGRDALVIDLQHIGAGISVVACGLISAWGIGILSRILMSSLFSLKDARHRLAVIDTFVGMRFRRQIEGEEARSLFAFLLAPSQTGLLKGAEPPPVLEALLGLVRTGSTDVKKDGKDLL